MLMVRYFFLLLFYHLVSLLQMWPWTYVRGLLTWPVYFFLAMSVDADAKKTCVAAGASALLEMEGTTISKMPKFLRRRFENIHQEAVS